MELNGSNQSVHHHGLLAGVGAGAVAVLVVAVAALLLVRRLITQALGVVIWVFEGLVIVAAVAAVLFLCRYLWHRHLLMTAAAAAAVPVRAIAVTVPAPYAEVTAVPAPAAAITAGPVPAGEIGPAPVHLHLPAGMDPADVAVLLAGLRGGQREAGGA